MLLLHRILQALPSQNGFSLQLFLDSWNQSVTTQNPKRRTIGQFEDLSLVDNIVTALVPYMQEHDPMQEQHDPPIFTRFRYHIQFRSFLLVSKTGFYILT